MLDELSGLPRQMLVWHDFIVSKGMPVKSTCTEPL
jgi:hypothetical protein